MLGSGSVSDDALVREIRTLHDDLGDWLGTAADEAARERFLTQQHPDFSMVTLDGDVLARATLTDQLRGAGGAVPGLRIEIDDIEILVRTAETAVVRFRERHHRGGTVASRLTTAVLLTDPAARNGLRWRSVHETACDEK
ncbi:Uncharacterized protein conserved in bacteria [Nocardia otitidiscaviarum]|uniref:Uncharacterized protein conserved in bacteria n=1 Tax=Nocardia otitidiscaviarum TaxID=1823 RepID=A0A379JJG3_9NOCA|nr:Uncharacterized protein conserved in bacteria [Nocardia otitidiscaviarum]